MDENKFVIIDGLARSGTTLLHSTLNSQESVMSLRGVFAEPLSVNYGYGSWPGRQIRASFIKSKSINFSKYSIFNKFDSKDFTQRTLSNLLRLQQFQYCTYEDFKSFFIKINSIIDLDTIYENILNHTHNKVLSLRWNNCLSYFYSWTERDNHKWISVIRNPEDRAISYKKSHGASYKKSLNHSIYFAKKMESLYGHKNLLIIYYEDFISDPFTTMKLVNEFLELDQNINLKRILNSNGKEYRNETSDLVDQGLKREFGEKFKGFGKVKSYNKNLGFEKKLKKYKIYKRYY